jgi:hypothetical protein
LGEQLDGDAKKNAFSGVSQIWAQHDPAAALDYFAKHELMSEDGTMLNHVLTRWAGDDSQAALAWARVMPDGKLKDRRLQRHRRHGRQRSEGAAGLLSSLPVESQDDAAGNLANRWVAQRPHRRGDLEHHTPRRRSQDEGHPQSSSKSGRIATSTKPPPGWKNSVRRITRRAIHEFSRQVTNADPASAAAWASTISDPERRGRQPRAHSIANGPGADQQGAMDFIANSPAASPQLKQKLLAPR